MIAILIEPDIAKAWDICFPIPDTLAVITTTLPAVDDSVLFGSMAG